MQYFKPSDIRTVPCTVQNFARSGAAFAIDQDEEAVFIPVSIAEKLKIDIGDALTCYCIDQFLDENRRSEVTTRYRAIRVKIDQRLSDVLSGFEASELMASSEDTPPPAPRYFTLEEARAVIGELLKKRRAWTSDQLIEEVSASDKEAVMTSEMQARIVGWLNRLHDDGIIARCEIRMQASQEPTQYYAVTTDIFIQLVDDYELDDE